jgi:uncharacterized protein YjbI with pentapeptide repeats
MFKYSSTWSRHNNETYIKEAVEHITGRLQRYVVNEPNFETLLNKMAQYDKVIFGSQYFEGYTINTLKNINTLDGDKTKSFIINCPHFVDCNFTNAQILEFESRSGSFDNCNFTNSIFTRCRFHSNVFIRCNFTGASFHTFTDGSSADVGFYDCIFDNSNIKIVGNYIGGCDSYTFKNCSLKNADMSDCTFSINKVTFTNCNTSGTKFKNCEIYELDSDYLFRVEFLIKGGKILKNPSMIDEGLSWIGQNINPFC